MEPTPRGTATISKAPQDVQGTNRERGGKALLRRPTALGKPWSRTEAQWAEYSVGRKKQLSHIGRIYETEEGERADPACKQCAEQGEDVCMVYTSAAREKHHPNQDRGLKCARCSYFDIPCSFKSDYEPRYRFPKKRRLSGGLQSSSVENDTPTENQRESVAAQVSSEQHSRDLALPPTRAEKPSQTDSEAAGPSSSDTTMKAERHESIAFDEEDAMPRTIEGQIKWLKENQDLLAAKMLSFERQQSVSTPQSSPALKRVRTREAENARVKKSIANLELRIETARLKKREEALQAELQALEGGNVSDTDDLYG